VFASKRVPFPPEQVSILKEKEDTEKLHLFISGNNVQKKSSSSERGLPKERKEIRAFSILS
jgi:hypothetical protein